MARVLESEETLWREIGEQAPHFAITDEVDPQSQWGRFPSTGAAAMALGSATAEWISRPSAISFPSEAADQGDPRFRPTRTLRRKRRFHRKLREHRIPDGRLARGVLLSMP
jgi:hypothetical protein